MKGVWLFPMSDSLSSWADDERDHEQSASQFAAETITKEFLQTPTGAKMMAERALELLGDRVPTFQGQGDPRFFAILHQMAELHVRKAEDYGADEDPLANLRASSEFGVAPWVGSLVRLRDKVKRLGAFAIKGRLANESAEDSMMDIANYALLTLILYREETK